METDIVPPVMRRNLRYQLATKDILCMDEVFVCQKNDERTDSCMETDIHEIVCVCVSMNSNAKTLVNETHKNAKNNKISQKPDLTILLHQGQ
jgi:hypothetical protein